MDALKGARRRTIAGIAGKLVVVVAYEVCANHAVYGRVVRQEVIVIQRYVVTLRVSRASERTAN
jgi:hypothetical protein